MSGSKVMSPRSPGLQSLASPTKSLQMADETIKITDGQHKKDDRRKASRKKQLLDDLREDVAGGFGGSRDPFQGMTAK